MLYLVLYKHCLQELKKKKKKKKKKKRKKILYQLIFLCFGYFIFWVRFLLSSFVIHDKRLKSKDKKYPILSSKSLNKWNQQRAENEMLLDTKDLCEVLSAIKITLIEIHGDEENTIMHQRRSPIIIQRIAFALFLLNDVRLMWRIIHIDKNENAMLLFTSSFPTPETGLLDAISPRKRGC